MTRRLIRGSRFHVGQRVRVQAEYTGDYLGVVTETHPHLLKDDQDDHMVGKAGVTVKVDHYDGDDLAPEMTFHIYAWDDETVLVEGAA